MFKTSPRRSPRSNMVKVKYAVQILLLLGASLWLIYQVKHSRDQNPTLLEGSRTSQKTSSGEGITEMGRNDLLDPPIVEDGEEEAKSEEEESNEAGRDGSGDFESPDHETEDDTHRGLEMSTDEPGDGGTPPEAAAPGTGESNTVVGSSGAGYEKAIAETERGYNNRSGDEGNEDNGFRESGKSRESVDFEKPVTVEIAEAHTPRNAEEKEEEREAGEERERIDSQAMASPSSSLMETTQTDLSTLPDTGAATTDVETMAAE